MFDEDWYDTALIHLECDGLTWAQIDRFYEDMYLIGICIPMMKRSIAKHFREVCSGGPHWDGDYPNDT